MLSFNSFYLFIEYLTLDKLGVGVVTEPFTEGCFSFERVKGKCSKVHI